MCALSIIFFGGEEGIKLSIISISIMILLLLINCSLPDSLLKRGERVLCLSCRFVRNSLSNLFSSKLLNSTLSGVHHISGPYINTYNKVSTKRANILSKQRKNKERIFLKLGTSRFDS